MRTVTRSMIVSAAVAFGLGAIPVYAADTDANLSGSYGFRFMGIDNIANAPTGVWIVGTGVFVADGRGQVTGGSITYNDNGDVCNGTLIKSTYNVAPDGEGQIIIQFTAKGGTCPINPTFQFATAITLPNAANVFQHVQMSTTGVTINSAFTTKVMVAGEADLM